MCIGSNAPSRSFQAILRVTCHYRTVGHQYGTYLHLAVMPNATTLALETDLVSWQLILLLHLPKAGGLTSHPMNNKLAEEYRDLDRTSTGQAVYSVDDIQPTNKF
jgi:hypothetical protein